QAHAIVVRMISECGRDVVLRDVVTDDAHAHVASGSPQHRADGTANRTAQIVYGDDVVDIGIAHTAPLRIGAPRKSLSTAAARRPSWMASTNAGPSAARALAAAGSAAIPLRTPSNVSGSACTMGSSRRVTSRTWVRTASSTFPMTT